MPGLVPGIHVFKRMDIRDKPAMTNDGGRSRPGRDGWASPTLIVVPAKAGTQRVTYFRACELSYSLSAVCLCVNRIGAGLSVLRQDDSGEMQRAADQYSRRPGLLDDNAQRGID